MIFKIFHIFLILFVAIFNCVASNGIIYFCPPAGLEDRIFDMDDTFCNHDDLNRPFYNLRLKLKELGYDFVATRIKKGLPHFKGLIVCHIPSEDALRDLREYPKDKLMLLLMEPPTVYPEYYQERYHYYFGKVLTMLDDFIDNKKYFKLYYPQPSLTMHDIVPFKEKKLLTLISSIAHSPHPLQLYSERGVAAQFFWNCAPEDFDLYGFNWDKKKYPCYKGSPKAKKEVQGKYKFCICYENMREVNGYLTEKIFDAFKAGCVPIYWGAKNVTSFIPKNCFIDKRDFSTYEDLYLFLNSMDNETYQTYITNIKNFLESDKAHLFSSENFVETILQHFI